VLRLYRIASARHPLMDGTGASLQGARWNSPGLGPIYAAENYSAAYLELMVQFGRIGLRPFYHYCSIDVPDDVEIENSRFPLEELDREAATRRFGNQWWRQLRTAVLQVPSAVTRVDSTYLLNPKHAQFDLLQPSQPKPVYVDPRLTAAAQGWKPAAP